MMVDHDQLWSGGQTLARVSQALVYMYAVFFCISFDIFDNYFLNLCLYFYF